MYSRRWPAIVACTLLVASGIASAHEVGGSRFDAPIPLEFLFLGAGATVAVTAVWLGSTERSPTREASHRMLTVSPRYGRWLRLVGRVGFGLVFVAALAHGFLGKQVQAENFATVFVWPIWIKGVGLVATLFGSPWRVLSPWRSLYEFLTALEDDEIAVLGSYPSRLGTWPALIGFVVGIGVLENLTVVPRSPRGTVVVIASYTLIMLVGGLAFGPRWFDRADTLTVLYRFFGRVSPIAVHRTDGGGYRVTVRPPWRGCTESVRAFALVAFIVAMVYTVSFDGFTSTPEYQALLFGVRTLLSTGVLTGMLLYVGGLLGFLASYAGVSALMQRLATGLASHWGRTARAFAPTILPIAVAYEVAHNFPFVVRNVGQALTLLQGVLGSGSGSISLLGWLSLPVFWGVQILLIVLGHIIAVVAAHQVAIRRYETVSDANRGHLPLVVLMIGYTVLSLWIISRPVVAG